MLVKLKMPDEHRRDPISATLIIPNKMHVITARYFAG